MHIKKVQQIEKEIKTNENSNFNLKSSLEEDIKVEYKEFISARQKEISVLSLELEEIKKEMLATFNPKKINEYKGRYDSLFLKIFALKKRYLYIDSTTPVLEYDVFSDEILLEKLLNYKYKSTEESYIDFLSHNCSHDLEIISKVFGLYEKTLSTTTEIENHEEKSITLEKKFNEKQEEFQTINNKKKELEKQVEKKISEIEKNLLESPITLDNKYKDVIANLMYISILTTGFKQNIVTFLVGSYFINKIINKNDKKMDVASSNKILTKLDEIYLSESEELKSIIEVLDVVGNDVKKFKEEFVSNFEEYKDDFEEYKDLLDKLDDIEKTIKKESDNAQNRLSNSENKYIYSKKYIKKVGL